MKKLLALVLDTAFLISLYPGVAPAQKRPSQISLLATGEFHGGEVTAESGERWLGLFPNGGGSELLPTTLKVEAVHDPVVDDKPEAKTGKKVSVSDQREPLFLLRGAGALPRGDVPTVFMEERHLRNADDINLPLGGKDYRMQVVSDDPAPATSLKHNSRLVLKFEGTSQVLFSVQEAEAGGWTLLWAGDLDGDGKLDLFMDLTNHDNSSRRRLFLSTRATEGELVREVAEFSIVGC